MKRAVDALGVPQGYFVRALRSLLSKGSQVAFLLVVASTLAAAGCDKRSSTARLPPVTEEPRGEGGAPNADQIPEQGDRFGDFSSADGYWEAFSTLESGQQYRLSLLGSGGESFVFEDAVPVAFSPDNSLFLFIGAEQGLVRGLYLVRLTLRPLISERITNQGVTTLADPAFLPNPNGPPRWTGHSISYTFPGNSTLPQRLVEVDLAASSSAPQ